MVLFQHFVNCDYCLSFWELGKKKNHQHSHVCEVCMELQPAAIPGQVDINMEEK